MPTSRLINFIFCSIQHNNYQPDFMLKNKVYEVINNDFAGCAPITQEWSYILTMLIMVQDHHSSMNYYYLKSIVGISLVPRGTRLSRDVTLFLYIYLIIPIAYFPCFVCFVLPFSHHLYSIMYYNYYCLLKMECHGMHYYACTNYTSAQHPLNMHFFTVLTMARFIIQETAIII